MSSSSKAGLLDKELGAGVLRKYCIFQVSRVDSCRRLRSELTCYIIDSLSVHCAARLFIAARALFDF